MRKKYFIYRFFLLTTVLFCFCIKNFAQQQDEWSYQYYNTSHGLPSSEIIALAKDSKGFLWLGTAAGLSMYDGYSFQNHPYAKENELIGYVNVIKPDAANRLWIGSGFGLFCYVNNEIIKVSVATALPQGVNDIAVDTNGAIWLATENGPAKFNTSDVDFTGKKKIMLADHLLKQWDLKNKIIDKRRTVLIGKAADGTVYIAGQNTLFKLIGDKLEKVFDIADSRNKILSLFPVSKSTVYFDAASTEINKIENGIAFYSNPKKLYKPNTDNLPGIWYAGTRGAFYFHPQNGTTSDSIIFSDKYLVWATAVLKDEHFFWVASHEGLIKLKPSIFTAYDMNKRSSYNDYYSITELRNGNLLLGANFGKVFEKKGNTFTLYKDNLVKSAEIKGFYEDETDRLWIASGYQGLVLVYDEKEERFTVENGLHDNSVYQFLKTSDAKLYVIGDGGMSEIIVNTDKTVSFKKYHSQPNISQYAKFFSAVEAPDGTIWIGGEEGIVYLRNDSLYKFIFNNKQLSVNFLIKDEDGTVWVATSGEGIFQCRFTEKNELEIVKQFTDIDGLNTLHYLTLLADKENNIWAGSSRGISVIGTKGKNKGRVLNFDESDGFIRPGYSYISLYQDKKKNIWAATSFGITSFKPFELLQSASSPVVFITGIRELKKNQLLNDSTGKNQFSYSNNSFNFNFTALDYVNQDKIRYYYKLDGLDSNWTNSGNLRSISFENLSPGNYSFRIKALNSKGIWSKKDAVYNFRITPPFWKRWWFIVSLIIIALSITIYIFNRKEKSAKLNLRAKEKELELTRLSHDLAASKLTVLRTQMNPHFIFNSLNSIQQYILQGNVAEANRYLSKFSKLQREILHYSNENFIPLEKEIEILDSYLQLEQLRFGESFTYIIGINQEVDPAEIKIPPMMLQPFAENAIWHGLMPKQGERNVEIRFSFYTDDILLAVIRDNGIGREASAKLKQNNGINAKQHESKGMSLVHERMALLQQQYGKPFDTSASDIVDENGIVQGTEVVLKIYIGDKT